MSLNASCGTVRARYIGQDLLAGIELSAAKPSLGICGTITATEDMESSSQCNLPNILSDQIGPNFPPLPPEHLL